MNSVQSSIDRERIHFNMDEALVNEIWIEGIGSNFGLFHNLQTQKSCFLIYNLRGVAILTVELNGEQLLNINDYS